MTEEFVDMLTDEKKSSGFELHQFQRDSEGKERYQKVDKKDAAYQTKYKGMAYEIMEATKD